VILSLTDAGMDRSVTGLVESGVELPWWWVYGRQFDSAEKAPNSRRVLSCDRVSDVLPHSLRGAQQRLDQMRATEESLRKHREKYGARTKRPEPSKSVTESWQRIEAWYAENVHELTDSLAQGASEAAIEQFEKEIGARLPDDFKESVRVHDGGDWWVPWRHGDLLSLEGILRQWRMYSDWQAKGEYATGDDWVPRDMTGPIKPVFWNKRRIYVTDNSGNHLTLDLDPPAGGTYGQVLHHSHEVGPTGVVARGWAEFLKMLVDDLESGKYVYLEHEGSVELVEEVERELADGV
jgi:cell wall assembly regulator SMI1